MRVFFEQIIKSNTRISKPINKAERYVERNRSKEGVITLSSHYGCLIELNLAGQLSPVGWFADDDIADMVRCLIILQQSTSERAPPL